MRISSRAQERFCCWFSSLHHNRANSQNKGNVGINSVSFLPKVSSNSISACVCVRGHWGKKRSCLDTVSREGDGSSKFR